jgi:hypothetical protein
MVGLAVNEIVAQVSFPYEYQILQAITEILCVFNEEK